MIDNNVIEFCQWLIDEKGVNEGSLSDYIQEHLDGIDDLSAQFKKFQQGGIILNSRNDISNNKIRYYLDKVIPYRFSKNIGEKINSTNAYNHDVSPINISDVKMVRIPKEYNDDVSNGSWRGIEGSLKRAINDKDFLSKIGYRPTMFKCGGKSKNIEKAQYGEKLSGKDYRDIKINRGVIRRAAKKNFGFNNAQFQTAFENAKYGFRNQGLSRREANIAAQKAMMNNTSDTQLPSMKVDLSNNMNIDRSVLDRVAQGPKKVFIDRVDPIVTTNDYKINADFN